MEKPQITIIKKKNKEKLEKEACKRFQNLSADKNKNKTKGENESKKNIKILLKKKKKKSII